MFKLHLEKAEEPEIRLPASTGSSKQQESSRKTSTSALLTMPKPLTVWITTNCGKFFKSFPQFVVIHTVKGFSVVNDAEVDAFPEFPCFPYDPMNAGHLISGFFAFSKPSLYIWKFLVHLVPKPTLSITLQACEISTIVQKLNILWHCPSL